MSNWIIVPNKIKNPKIRLFCFPYAGSSAVVTYKFISDHAPEDVEVCMVEFPGRGSRMTEGLISDISIVVNEIYDNLLKFLDIPYAFLGHSMGALTAYELGKKIQQNNLMLPYKLYLSAHRAPQLKRNGKTIYKLNDDEFLDELILMKGIDSELLKHDELLKLFAPIIRNDYELCETYSFKGGGKLKIPFHVFAGSEDEYVKPDDLKLWSELTTVSISTDIIEGDHFFIIKEKQKFLKIFLPLLEDDLKNYGIKVEK